jgi:hypothetical protein
VIQNRELNAQTSRDIPSNFILPIAAMLKKTSTLENGAIWERI